MGIFSKPCCKYYFLRKRHKSYHVVKIVKESKPKKMVSFKKKSFTIDLKIPVFVANTTLCYFIDIDTGEQMKFEAMESQLNPDDLDIIVGQKIIRELTKGVVDNRKEKLYSLLLGLIIGGLITGLIMVMYYTGKIEEILKNALEGYQTPEIIPTG